MEQGDDAYTLAITMSLGHTFREGNLMNIVRPQVNHITNPLGFDLGAAPTFTWAVEGAKGTRAEASRVVVTCGGEVVVDTGWADLDAKACALDMPLSPRTRYEWTVSVRSDAGETSLATRCSRASLRLRRARRLPLRACTWWAWACTTCASTA